MAGTVVADTIQADSTSTLVLKNGVANTPPTIQDSAGTQIGTFCRAWVNFNGTGAVAIRASFNVTSITDNGVGRYQVNITNALPDANYAASILASTDNTNAGGTITGFVDNYAASNVVTAPTTTAFVFSVYQSNTGTMRDATYVNVSVFR
jgi:hypothetical protein